MGLNGKQLLENFKEDEAYGNTTYTPPADEDSNDDNAWKYISAGDISGLVDYTNRNYNYRTIPFLGQHRGLEITSMRRRRKARQNFRLCLRQNSLLLI